jgi:hypothetical protein
MYEGVIYFAGPRSRWSGRIDDGEIVARFAARWRWLARAQMLSAFSALDQTRCGYALLKNGVPVEQYDPPLETAAPAVPEMFRDGTVIDGLAAAARRRKQV